MSVLHLNSCLSSTKPTFSYLNNVSLPRHSSHSNVSLPPRHVAVKAMKETSDKKFVSNTKPEICTADELHYVSVHNSYWKLALWRYLPSNEVEKKNHPLLLLSGVGTNAVGYDLSPEASFARFMCGQGFDTWTLEVRGAGLSSLGTDHRDGSQAKDWSENLLDIFGGTQQSISLPFQEYFPTALQSFMKELGLITKYDWDFDHFLEEDLPAVMEYIRTHTKPDDGKLLAIGHSMGGILLYAMLARCAFEGRDPGLTAVTTLASSLDYSSSNSSLKLLLPVADPAKAFNVPVIPVGVLLAAAHPLASRPPYLLSWLTLQVSAPGMMHPKLIEKLVLNNFCTVSSKLLLQLTTAFEKGGLKDRSGSFLYKNHLGKSDVPVLAFAGDQDLICPPLAAYETVKVIPEHLLTYKVFGEPGGPHYAHYDLIGSRMAFHQVYPCIIDFLNQHDM